MKSRSGVSCDGHVYLLFEVIIKLAMKTDIRNEATKHLLQHPIPCFENPGSLFN